MRHLFRSVSTLRLGTLAMLGLAACSDSSSASKGDASGEDEAGAASNSGQNQPDSGADSPSTGGADGDMDGGPHSGAGDDDGGDTAPPTFTLPPVNEGLDYQLGGAYAPAASVKIVSRDRTETIAAGLYNICYVNGFQIQPGEEAAWMKDHPDLILRDAGGEPVIDADWDEMLIDVGTPAKRDRVAAIVGAWIEGCAQDGYDAIEIDNLDSFSRSNGLLKESDAIATMALFSDVAHAAGLAIAQKNSAELVPRRAAMGTDFVVVEECNRYDECDAFTAGYGDHVLVIEYRQADFKKGCAAYPNLSIVLRDVDLVTPGDGAYVFDGC